MPAEGQRVNQIGIDLMECIEIGKPAQRKRIPRVDDNPAAIQIAARSSRSFIRADTLRRRGLIKRLRERVIELPLQIGPTCVVGHLERVVIGRADVPPGIQRAELVVKERVRPQFTVRHSGVHSGDRRGHIHLEQGERFVMREAVPKFVDILRSRGIGGVTARCAQIPIWIGLGVEVSVV